MKQEVLKGLKKSYKYFDDFYNVQEDSLDYCLITKYSNELYGWFFSDRNDNQVKNDEWYWGVT
jgi:hypothetical protein